MSAKKLSIISGSASTNNYDKMSAGEKTLNSISNSTNSLSNNSDSLLEQMNIVIVGHVDHGKSTVIGRLLADTDSLPEGKLEQVKAYCEKNSKVFEYAFLLDALKDEQDQGVTINSARCFFKTDRGRYTIIDAPGHVEFLKNMISGAARAEAALLVIDASEGIMENSKRHAYLLSLLGIRQIAVLVNKMDLIGFDEEKFNSLVAEFSYFLDSLKLKPKFFIPVSARDGDNISSHSKNTLWFKGPTVLEVFDSFEKEPPARDKPFRMPVQGVYKFTDFGDSRRIISGRVESGSIAVGDKVVFLPSGKTSTIASIEEFNAPKKNLISAGESTAFTLSEQIFVKRGEVTCSLNDKALVGSRFKANIFWMGKEPLVLNKHYKLKLGTSETEMIVSSMIVLDATTLSSSKADVVNRHDIAEIIIETKNPVAFDTFASIKVTGRFVVVDGYDIAGGGIIIEKLPDSQDSLRTLVYERENKRDRGLITARDRALRFGQSPVVVLITGKSGIDKKSIAKSVEASLFNHGRAPYFFGIGNILRGLDADISKEERVEHIRRFGEVSHLLLDAGLLVLATASDLTDDEVSLLRTIINPSSLVVVLVGDSDFLEADLYLEPDDSNNSRKVLEFLIDKKIVFWWNNGF